MDMAGKVMQFSKEVVELYDDVNDNLRRQLSELKVSGSQFAEQYCRLLESRPLEIDEITVNWSK